jgi:hypothetical protein
MMEAVRTSETSVDNHFTRQYIPEDNSEHHTRRRENLKSHKFKKRCLFFFQSRSLAEPLATTLGFRGTPVEKPCHTAQPFLISQQYIELVKESTASYETWRFIIVFQQPTTIPYSSGSLFTTTCDILRSQVEEKAPRG